MADKFKRTNYFPTMVFQIEVENQEVLNAGLKKSIYEERERDNVGINRSNIPGLGGWHSHNNLHKMPEYADLVGHINKATRKISKDLGYASDQRMSIGTMWSIINPPGAANRTHVHPGCLWSGAYYVQSPENSGQFEMTDPRVQVLMNQASFLPKTKRKRDCWTKVKFTPSQGKMLIFPAWLYHGVDPNLSTLTGADGDRIVIAFNLNQQKIQQKKK